eukprot:gene13720-12453_t
MARPDCERRRRAVPGGYACAPGMQLRLQYCPPHPPAAPQPPAAAPPPAAPHPPPSAAASANTPAPVTFVASVFD